MEVKDVVVEGRPAKYGLLWRVAGKRRTKFFRTLKARREFRAELEGLVLDHGKSGLALLSENAADVMAARDLLGRDVSFVEAARFYVRNNRVQNFCCLTDAVELFLSDLAQREAGEPYRCNAEGVLSKMVARFDGDAGVESVSAQALQEWLSGLKLAPITKNTYRKFVRLFFAMALDRGWVSIDPSARLRVPRVVESEPGILSVADVERVFCFAQANCPELLVYLALGFFAGMRTSAIVRLDRSDVDFEQRGILMPGAKHKTGRRFFVDGFPVNLWEWLEDRGQRSEDRGQIGIDPWDISSRNWNRWRASLAEGAGVVWPHNAMRHSFASYHVAAFGSADKTATLLTHQGSHILYKHYRGNASRGDGERFFRIVPEV